MPNDPLAELLDLTNRPDLAEAGGGHGQKGVEFQRHWAIMRMFELEKSGEKDFLLLFEAIQDVAVVDSCGAPTSICVYQVKKKDRNEWGWSTLTALHEPSDPTKPPGGGKTKPLSSVQNSPIGKLYATVSAFKTLQSTGRFVSNAGCNIALADGTNAATSLPTALSLLPLSHLDLLSKALETLHAVGEPVPDLSRIHLERVALSVDDPGTHIVGVVHKFLEGRSPRHAGQARSLVDALLVATSQLGAKTDTCKTFEDLRRERGFSKGDLTNALSQLQTIPDCLEHLETWLRRLTDEGVGFRETTTIRAAAASLYRRQVMGASSPEEQRLVASCDAWIDSHPDPTNLKPYFQSAFDDLSPSHALTRKPELIAHLALRAIQKCVDQT